MIYGQMISKQCKRGHIIVKFIYYRKDINKIIYEINNDIHQDNAENFSILTQEIIEKFYNNKINNKKKKIYKIKKKLNRPQRDIYLEKMKQLNIKIKELTKQINYLQTINVLINSNNKSLTGPKIKLSNAKKRKKIIQSLYNSQMRIYKQHIKTIQLNKKVIGELKQQKKKIVIDENETMFFNNN